MSSNFIVCEISPSPWGFFLFVLVCGYSQCSLDTYYIRMICIDATVLALNEVKNFKKDPDEREQRKKIKKRSTWNDDPK